MKALSKTICLSTLLVILSGCSTHVKRETPPANPNYPVHFEKIIQDDLQKSLRDYNSALINRLNNPVKYTYQANIGMFKTEPVTGYAVCYKVNAKNNFNEYVGDRYYLYMFDGEKLIYNTYQENQPQHLVDALRIFQACQAIVPAAPFRK